MIDKSNIINVLGDFVERYVPKRCGNMQLPVLSVTKEKAMVFQNDRFETSVASRDKSNYLVVPKGYLVQGIHIDERNFGLQNIADYGIVSPAYKIWKITSGDIIPELLEYFLRSSKAIEYFKNNFQGSTVKRRQVIKKSDLLNLPINMPEMKSQLQFYEFFKQADKSKFTIQHRPETLKKSLMQEYFG